MNYSTGLATGMILGNSGNAGNATVSDLITIFLIVYVVTTQVVSIVVLLVHKEGRGRDFLFAFFVFPFWLPFKILIWLYRNF